LEIILGNSIGEEYIGIPNFNLIGAYNRMELYIIVMTYTLSPFAEARAVGL
jgi:membrane-bound lytic murein transglycosylase B